jgi:hypothetical protein
MGGSGSIPEGLYRRANDNDKWGMVLDGMDCIVWNRGTEVNDGWHILELTLVSLTHKLLTG